YILSFLHFIGFTFIFSEKILLFSVFTGSGLIMYIALKKLIKNNFAAFAGSIIYLFTPYHLVDLHFRVSIAEDIGFVIAPAIFYLILKIRENSKMMYILLLGLLFGIFWQDHPPQVIFYSGIFFAWLLYQHFFIKKNFKVLVNIFIAYCLGIVVSLFFFVIRLTLTQYTHGPETMSFKIGFVSILQLLYSPWRWGFLFQGHKGELSVLIGYTQVLLLIFSIYFLFKKKLTSEINRQ